jgi:precorrin-6Y C5,15-methyltransferase (decarboxylating)
MEANRATPPPPGRLDVLGTDGSGLEGMAPPALTLLAAAVRIAAPSRLLPGLRHWCSQRPCEAGDPGPTAAPELLCSDHPAALLPQLVAALAAGERLVLLASGDPLWFGIGRVLLQHIPREQLRFHPAPTSLQLAFARLGRPWQDAAWISLHGRDPEPLAARLQQRPPALAVLTDPGQEGAEVVRRLLGASGLEAAYGLWLLERLGHPAERVSRLPPGQPLPADLDPLHLLVLIAEPPPWPDPASLPLFGLDDGLWLQHADQPGLMTKREVRIQLLADLELPAQGTLWDLGAGVGSVGLEALRLRPALALWAVERRLGAAALIQANADRLGVRPAGVVEAVAPHRDRLKAAVVFPSMPEVMRLNKVGTFTMANLGQSKSVIGEFMKKKKKENGSSFEEGMLKLLRTLPKVLKFLPSDKAKDARNFINSLQYWLGGSSESLENLILNVAQAYVPALKDMSFEAAAPEEVLDVGIWHPLAPTFYDDLKEYLNW